MGKLTIIQDHPLIKHKITILRDEKTGTNEFRKVAGEVAMLLGYEATKNLVVEEKMVKTPIREAKGYILSGKKLGLVPILRAGLGMVDGLLELIPTAKVGHIGLYRDPETKKPIEYYCKLPLDVAEREIFVLDPMLATGGSASAAITMLKDRGCEKIRLISIIGAPEGIEVINRDHPDVDIYLAQLDEGLNSDAYIVPGLGDAGDRLFGTK